MSTRNLAQPVASATFPWRRVTMAVLLAAGVVALASLAGPAWVIRIGAVLGLAAGVVAAVLAVRAIRRLDERHREAYGDQTLALERAHGDLLREHRAHDEQVADTLRRHLRHSVAESTQLRDRLDASDEVINSQRKSIDQLRTERNELRAELRAKDGVISGLRETLSVREEELAAMLGDVDEAEVYAMPRRVRTAVRAADPEVPELVELAQVTAASQAAPVEDLRAQA